MNQTVAALLAAVLLFACITDEPVQQGPDTSSPKVPAAQGNPQETVEAAPAEEQAEPEKEKAPEEAPQPVPIEEWLAAGPLPLIAPAFDESGDAARTGAFLDAKWIDRAAWPEEGGSGPWLPGRTMEWKTVRTEGGIIESERPEGEATPRVVYLAAYLVNTKWQKVTIEVRGNRPFALLVDGKEKTRSTAFAGDGDEPSRAKASLPLNLGKHRIVVKGIDLPGKGGPAWKLEAQAAGEAGTLSFSTSPERSFTDLFESNNLSSLGSFALSPDGRSLALALTEKKRDSSSRSQAIVFLEMPSGKETGRLTPGGGSGSLTWSPDVKLLAFRNGGKLLCHDPAARTTVTVLADTKGIGRFVWSADSRFIFFRQTGSGGAKKESGYVRLDGVYSRLSDYNETATLQMVSVTGGVRHALTKTGKFAIEDFALSPDGNTIVFVKRYPVPERPFFATEFRALDLQAGKERLVLRTTFPFENWPANLCWSPDGRKIAFTGPPAQVAAGGEAKDHNYFETDLWILDIETATLERRSDSFDECVNSPLFWNAADDRIYFIAHRRTRQLLARVPASGTDGIEVLEDGPTVVTALSLASGGEAAVFAGSSVETPQTLHFADLDDWQQKEILDPNAGFMKRMELGPWEEWDFVNSRNQALDGFLFYPPGFDAEKRYPLVVYFYGGTAPQMERFSITYYHWIPANGYMLYVVNPAGAVGYGEAFSDLHVNDWGKLAAADIIEGVEKLLEEKTFIDRERIAAYGGSYGGFMTLSLITKTDLFKASCSLYGISNLASYWGSGIWGYTYGDTAMAQSYPWNRRDLFVERSPLFNADKVRSALLLMHGTSDTNVPSVESEQMFTALQVLGKDVAYVRFPGQEHGIAGSRTIYYEHRRMMLEWFDKYLKDQPEAWEKRWE